MGPGTKLPTLGHAPYATLRDAYQQNAEGMIAGGADALLVETTQDLLQTKAAILGARRAMEATGSEPAADLLGDRRDDRHDAAGLGDRRGADGAGAAGHRHDRPELRDRPGRDERAPALPRPPLAHPAVLHAQRGSAGAGQGRRALPADAPASWPTRRRPSSREYGLSLVGGCCGTTPEHLRQVVERVRGIAPPRARRRAPSRAPPRSTRRCRSARTPRTWRSVSGPTPTGRRSSARRCWRAAGTTAWRWPATRSARARTCSTCASTTSAVTASRTWRSWPAGSPPPPRCRSCWTPRS